MVRPWDVVSQYSERYRNGYASTHLWVGFQTIRIIVELVRNDP
jgi:hypothetical protein